jgi:hypothetical protein
VNVLLPSSRSKNNLLLDPIGSIGTEPTLLREALPTCFAHSSTLKMKVVCSSEMSLISYQTIQRHISLNSRYIVQRVNRVYTLGYEAMKLKQNVAINLPSSIENEQL